jgi:hypothetical protein
MVDFAFSCTTTLLLYFVTRLYLLHLFLIWVYALLVIFLIFPFTFLPSQPYLLFPLFPSSYLPSFSTFFLLKPWLILVGFGLFFWIWTLTFWFIAFHLD